MSKFDDIEDEYLDIPLIQGVILNRSDDGTPRSNVPHLIVHHSPTGYEWGFSGSGPADLSLNILENILRQSHYTGEIVQIGGTHIFHMAWTLHHIFKDRFIAHINIEGGKIEYETIAQWIADQITAIQEAAAQKAAGK